VPARWDVCQQGTGLDATIGNGAVTEPMDGGAATTIDPPQAGSSWPVLSGASRLELVDLSIIEQDDGFIVGDSARGAFVQMPSIGVAVIERLRAGASIAEVSATFRETASSATASPSGQETAAPPGDVDVLDFANTLVELGFVAAVDDAVIAATGSDEPERRWLTGPPPEKIRWLFGRVARSLYSLLFAGCIATEIAVPSYRPHASDFFFLNDPLASVAILTLISFTVVGGHECFHWLAGSAQGVGARFAISRRLYFLVFETDLTQLWSVPRRRRYGPLLAGMAFDTTVLSATIAIRMLIASGAATVPSTATRLLSAVATLVTTNLVWQFCVFLRNDLYLVLSTLLGCLNLWRIAILTIKRTLWHLTPDEQAELAAGDDRSRWHARWYSWLCVVGVAGTGWYAADIMAPAIWRVIRTLANRLISLPATGPRFWEALIFGTLALLPLLLAAYVLIRDLRNKGAGSSTR
jgi:putative peptide zinc metalloprotease protein